MTISSSSTVKTTVVHVSGDEDALTKADIAILEGLQNPTYRRLVGQIQYGANEDMALAEDAGQSFLVADHCRFRA
jgi:hypothetical protein